MKSRTLATVTTLGLLASSGAAPQRGIAAGIHEITGPTTITIPGHYRLTADIDAPDDVWAIVVDASDVTLDLGGHHISVGGFGVGVLVGLDPVTNVHVSNGTISGRPGGGIGVYLGGGGHSQVRDVTVTNLPDFGIALADSGSNVIVDNTAFDNPRGIFVVGGSVDNKIIHNTAIGNQADLQDQNLQCGSNHWVNNTFETSFVNGEPQPACIR